MRRRRTTTRLVRMFALMSFNCFRDFLDRQPLVILRMQYIAGDRSCFLRISHNSSLWESPKSADRCGGAGSILEPGQSQRLSKTRRQLSASATAGQSGIGSVGLSRYARCSVDCDQYIPPDPVGTKDGRTKIPREYRQSTDEDACADADGRSNVKQTRAVEVSARLLALLWSGALPGGDGREGRPGLFDLVTTAVRTGDLVRVMLCDGQNLRECFFAGVAEELIVGHTNLPQPLNGYGWILDPWLEHVQFSPYALRKRQCSIHRWRMVPTVEGFPR